MSRPKAEIVCADALDWLSKQQSISNLVTGICDLAEMPGYDMDSYLEFFTDIVDLIFSKLQDGCYAVFIQTDRKYQRSWIDKSYIITNIARNHGMKTIWHKIVLHRSVDATDLHRPTYAHMLCYSRDGTTGIATPDVIPVSRKSYKNATPPEAAKRALEFISKYSKVREVLDPFVGRGTIPLLALELGLSCIGIDIDPEQCEITRKLLDASAYLNITF
jgi:DNA modification methylase